MRHSSKLCNTAKKDGTNRTRHGRDLKIGCDTRDDIATQVWPTTYGPGPSFKELLTHLLPWADFAMDSDAYYDFMEDRWMTECYCGHDSETGENYYSMSFERYRKHYSAPNDEIVPISEDGETEGYRLILSLNELGKAFVLINDYLSDKDDFEDKTFALRPFRRQELGLHQFAASSP